MGELLYCGEVEKWSNTARGKTWRKFFIRLTNREIRWHLPSEEDQNVFLGEIEVSRIVNVKLDPNSELNEPDFSMFLVQDPQISHEFRTATRAESEIWVQHIKNATLPKTRRKKLPEPTSRDRLQSSGSAKSNISVKSSQDNPAMVTEIMGGTHIVRPSDPTDSETKPDKTSTILIMNSLPESGFAARSSVDSDTDLSEVQSEHTAPIVREGYLIKQGQKIKNWRRRWFTLSSSVLTYREEEGTAAKGVIYMADVILARRSCKYPDKKFLFEVITKKRTYYMMASSQDEMASWTDALTNILIPNHNCNNSDASSLSSS